MSYDKLLAMGAAIFLTAGGLTLTTTSAFGQEARVLVTAPGELVIRHISYADLNLASNAGEQTLNRRVEGEVARLCVEVTGGYAASSAHAMAICRRAAWGQAGPQISRAVQGAREIASVDTSTFRPVALAVPLPK